MYFQINTDVVLGKIGLFFNKKDMLEVSGVVNVLQLTFEWEAFEQVSYYHFSPENCLQKHSHFNIK